MRLAGKTALITAAGQGIGRATAEAFVAEGAKVWASDIDGAKVADIDGAQGFVLDVTDGAQIEAAAARTGAVDILFNCAGYVAVGTALECEPDDWDRSFAINIRGMYHMIRAYLPPMLEAGGGRIINMASVASSVKGIKGRAAYSASKAAVIGLTKSIAVDYIDAGIRCNALCPGTVETPSLGERIDAYDDPVAARQMFIDRQPMGRLAAASEIAQMCVYLASDAADFVTGQCMVIDGGVSL
jgi:2-keto-3-deoxy-L-fuconate dehydrogenase